MDALISGRGGLALVIDGGQLSSIHVAEPERAVQRQPAEVPYLLGEASDIVPVENVSRGEIVNALVLARGQENALHLALILLDPELPDDLRQETAEELEELLQQPEIGIHLENVFYAHPLPVETDMAGAQRAARAKGAFEVSAFLELCWTYQHTIGEVREAWGAVPSREFAGEADQWQVVAVREGIFRQLVHRSMNDREVRGLLVEIANRPAVRRLPNHQEILRSWFAPFIKSRVTSVENMRGAPEMIVREPPTAYDTFPYGPEGPGDQVHYTLAALAHIRQPKTCIYLGRRYGLTPHALLDGLELGADPPSIGSLAEMMGWLAGQIGLAAARRRLTEHYSSLDEVEPEVSGELKDLASFVAGHVLVTGSYSSRIQNALGPSLMVASGDGHVDRGLAPDGSDRAHLLMLHGSEQGFQNAMLVEDEVATYREHRPLLAAGVSQLLKLPWIVLGAERKADATFHLLVSHVCRQLGLPQRPIFVVDPRPESEVAVEWPRAALRHVSLTPAQFLSLARYE